MSETYETIPTDVPCIHQPRERSSISPITVLNEGDNSNTVDGYPLDASQRGVSSDAPPDNNAVPPHINSTLNNGSDSGQATQLPNRNRFRASLWRSPSRRERLFTSTSHSLRRGFWCVISIASFLQFLVMFVLYLDNEEPFFGTTLNFPLQGSTHSSVTMALGSFPPSENQQPPRVLSWSFSSAATAAAAPASKPPGRAEHRVRNANRDRGPLSTALFQFVQNLDTWIDRWEPSGWSNVTFEENLSEENLIARWAEYVQSALMVYTASTPLTNVQSLPVIENVWHFSISTQTNSLWLVAAVPGNTQGLEIKILEGHGVLENVIHRALHTLMSDWLTAKTKDSFPTSSSVLQSANPLIVDIKNAIYRRPTLFNQPALTRLFLAIARRLHQLPESLGLRQRTHIRNRVHKVSNEEILATATKAPQASTIPRTLKPLTWDVLGHVPQSDSQPHIVTVDKASGNIAIVHELQHGEAIQWQLHLYIKHCAINGALSFRFKGAARVTAAALTGSHFIYSRFNDEVKFRVTPTSDICRIGMAHSANEDRNFSDLPELPTAYNGPPVTSQWFVGTSITAWDLQSDNTTLIVLSSVSPWGRKEANWFIELYRIGSPCSLGSASSNHTSKYVCHTKNNLKDYFYCEQSTLDKSPELLLCQHNNTVRAVVSLSMAPGAGERSQTREVRGRTVLHNSEQAFVALVSGVLPRVIEAAALDGTSIGYLSHYRVLVEDNFGTLATFDLSCDSKFSSCEPSTLSPVFPSDNDLPRIRSERTVQFSVGQSSAITGMADGFRLALYYRDDENSPLRISLHLEGATKLLGPAVAVVSVPRECLSTALSELLASQISNSVSCSSRDIEELTNEILGDPLMYDYVLVLFRRGDLVLLEIPIYRASKGTLLWRIVTWLRTIWSTSTTDVQLLTLQLVTCLSILTFDRLLKRQT